MASEHGAAVDEEVADQLLRLECEYPGGLGGGLCRESSKAIAGLLIQLILLGKQRKVHVREEVVEPRCS